MEDEISALFNILGASKPELPHYKAGARRRSEPWRDYYDSAADRNIRRQSGFELAFFGYDLNGGPYPQSATLRAQRSRRLDPARITNALRHPYSPLEKALTPLDHSERRE